MHPTARHEAGDSVVDARLQEEDHAKNALAELCDMGTDDPAFDGKLAEFEQAVVAHATEEEREEFPSLSQGLSADHLRQMAGAPKAAEASRRSAEDSDQPSMLHTTRRGDALRWMAYRASRSSSLSPPQTP